MWDKRCSEYFDKNKKRAKNAEFAEKLQKTGSYYCTACMGVNIVMGQSSLQTGPTGHIYFVKDG